MSATAAANPPGREIAAVRALRCVTTSLTLFLTAYWAWTFSGLYAWLAWLQMQAMPWYSSVAVCLATAIAIGVPLNIAARIVAAAAGWRFDAVPLLVNRLLGSRASVLMLFGAGLAAAGVTAAAVAARDAYFAGPLTEWTVEQLYANDVPPSRYVELRGAVLSDGRHTAMLHAYALNSQTEQRWYYFPMVPAAAAEGPFRVIVQTDVPPPAAHPEAQTRIRGFLRRPVPSPLPWLNRQLSIDEHAWLLDAATDPVTAKWAAVYYLSIFGGSGLAVIAGVFISGYRSASR